MTKEQYFACNPGVNELFFTADGQAFYDANKASAHAQRLKNRHVEAVSRQEVAQGRMENGELRIAPQMDEVTQEETDTSTGSAADASTDSEPSVKPTPNLKKQK
jgi:hypothetical protein